MIMLEGADYSHFSAFRFSADEYPDHLVQPARAQPARDNKYRKAFSHHKYVIPGFQGMTLRSRSRIC